MHLEFSKNGFTGIVSESVHVHFAVGVDGY